MPAFAPPYRLGTLPPIQVAQTRGGRLSYVVSGAGEPSLVLLNGAGMSLEGWRALYPRIERLGTVFAWNRFGVKGSDPPRQAPTGASVLASLRELLAYAGLPPPYVLVAHSLGGLYANLFARLYPEQVRAVLFLEATHPDDGALLRQHEGHFAQAIARLLALPRKLLDRNLHAEADCVDAIVDEVAHAGAFPDVPIAVVTGGTSPPGWLMSPAAAGARRANQQALARLGPRGEQVIAARSGHFPQLTEPQVVLDALARLIARS